MKNKQYFTGALFILCAILANFSAFSQTPPKGYEIVFKTHNTNEKYLYLIGIYGNEPYVVDSAKYTKNGYVFKNNKQILPSGFYTIESQNRINRIIHAEFIVDKTRTFVMDEMRDKLVFTHSEENELFKSFQSALEAGNELHIFYQTAPESLLAKFVLAQYIPVSIPEFFWGSHAGREVAAQKYYQALIDHFFDNVDFKDIRLMYMPLNIDLKDFFVESLYPQTAENVISSIENFFNRILDPKPTPEQFEVRDFYLKKLIHLYLTAEPKFDKVFIYLVDNYVAKLTQSRFISGSEADVFKRIAERKRKTLVGETIPVFESYTMEHHKISTADTKKAYTLLWFWDPDCEHCIENTPQLYDFYCKYHDLYNFEVIACSVTEDYDRWVAFIHKNHLEWFNTSYAISEPNYDAVEFFNFADTPAIFIIDKQHKIVARQFPLDELFEVFESLQN